MGLYREVYYFPSGALLNIRWHGRNILLKITGGQKAHQIRKVSRRAGTTTPTVLFHNISFQGEPAVDKSLEVRSDPCLHLFHRHRFTAQVTQGRHWATFDTAGMYPLEKGKISVHVQGETMHCHPTPDGNADRGEFSPVCPDSRTTGHTIGGDAKITGNADENFFQETEIMAQVLSSMAQPENGVPDQLARTMESNVAPTAYADNLNGGIQDICGISTTTYGIYRKVLQQKKLLLALTTKY
jgi:hypothetical protein